MLTEEDLARIDAISPATSNTGESTLGTTSEIIHKNVSPSITYIKSVAKLRINKFRPSQLLRVKAQYPQLLSVLKTNIRNRESWTDERCKRAQQKKEEEAEEQRLQKEKQEERERKIAKEKAELSEQPFVWQISEKLTQKELQIQCRKHGLSKSGSKSSLIERLKDHMHTWLPETCLCRWHPAFSREISFYTNIARIIFWDIETDHKRK